MQKVGVYILLLVIGAIIGLSIGIFVLMNQTPSMGEQVKVTIQGIEYIVSEHSVLEIELLNNVPEKNLEGNVTIYQAEKKWTGEVTWYYTGYGEAEIICDSINETQNFRIIYNENYPRAIYLERIIEWNEVSIGSSVTMAGSMMSVENIRFFVDAETKKVEIILRNSGTADGKIAEVYQGSSSSSLQVVNSVIYEPSTQIVNAGSSLKITFDLSWQNGVRYYFKVVSEEGLSVPFSEEC